MKFDIKKVEETRNIYRSTYFDILTVSAWTTTVTDRQNGL